MERKDCPCYGCIERAEGCHGRCEKYKAFEAKCKDMREKRYKYFSAIWPRAGVQAECRKHDLSMRRSRKRK